MSNVNIKFESTAIGSMVLIPQKKLDVKLSDKTIENLLPDWGTVEIQQVPRVVLQAIAPGTPVPKGTAIDITLAPKSILPGKVIDGVHASWQDLTFEAIENQFLQDPKVLAALQKYSTVQALTANPVDFELVKGAVEQAGLVLDETKPNSNFESAFVGLKGVSAFSG